MSDPTTTVSDPAPPAPLPSALAHASDPPPAAPQMPAGIDYARLAQEIARQMGRTSAPEAQVKPAERLPPTPNQGRPCFVYAANKAEPYFSLCTGEMLDDSHPGYIHVVMFPPGKAPEPVQCLAPADYRWA